MESTVAHDDEPHGVDVLTTDIGERGGVVVVSIAGELDIATVGRVAPLLDDAVGRGKPVVLDMSGLTFFSSAGLTLLARMDDQRQRTLLDVRLVTDQRTVLLPLRLTGLRDLFPVHPTLADALAAVGGNDTPG